MELYLVRHGQSLANTGLPIFDAALTDLGHAQAQALAQALSAIRFDRIYSSTLLRAAQTAAAVAQHQPVPVSVQLLPELVETGTPSDFTGNSAELYARHPQILPPHGTVPAFPSDDARAKYVLETYVFRPAYEEGFDTVITDENGNVSESRDLRILMASHGVFMAHLMANLVHFPFDPNMIVSLHNACICRFSLFTVNGVRRLKFITHNDTGHLRKDMLT